MGGIVEFIVNNGDALASFRGSDRFAAQAIRPGSFLDLSNYFTDKVPGTDKVVYLECVRNFMVTLSECVFLDRDGNTVTGNIISSYNTDTNEMLHTYNLAEMYGSSQPFYPNVNCFVLFDSPEGGEDDMSIVAGIDDGSIVGWNAKSGKVYAFMKNSHQTAVKGIWMSSKNGVLQYLVTASKAGVIKVWQYKALKNSECIATIDVGSRIRSVDTNGCGSVTALAVAIESPFSASCSVINIYCLQTGKLLRKLMERKVVMSVRCVGVEDGVSVISYFYADSAVHIRVWDNLGLGVNSGSSSPKLAPMSKVIVPETSPINVHLPNGVGSLVIRGGPMLAVYYCIVGRSIFEACKNKGERHRRFQASRSNSIEYVQEITGKLYKYSSERFTSPDIGSLVEYVKAEF
eukprot:Nk52_evm9s442 gene=Nk52_evmTU9s442